MILLGLTGSIGMGKSTTAAMFAARGIPVYDADAAVHALYGADGAAVRVIEEAFPGVALKGAIDRARLSARVVGDADALARLEALVHPLLGAHRGAFLGAAREGGARAAVLDVPLLFETGGDTAVDAVAVVSCPEAVQRARVLARPGMTAAKFSAIRARQWTDADKRARADFVIDTGEGLEPAERAVDAVLAALSDPAWRSRRRP